MNRKTEKQDNPLRSPNELDCKNLEIRQPRHIDHEEDIQHK